MCIAYTVVLCHRGAKSDLGRPSVLMVGVKTSMHIIALNEGIIISNVLECVCPRSLYLNVPLSTLLRQRVDECRWWTINVTCTAEGIT